MGRKIGKQHSIKKNLINAIYCSQNKKIMNNWISKRERNRLFPIDIIEMTEDRSFLNANLAGCIGAIASDCFIVYTAGAGVKQNYSWEIVISCVNHGDRLFSLSNNASRKILPLQIPISSIIIGDTLMDFHWLEATATTKNVFCLRIIYAMLTACFYVVGWILYLFLIVCYFRLLRHWETISHSKWAGALEWECSYWCCWESVSYSALAWDDDGHFRTLVVHNLLRASVTQLKLRIKVAGRALLSSLKVLLLAAITKHLWYLNYI